MNPSEEKPEFDRALVAQAGASHSGTDLTESADLAQIRFRVGQEVQASLLTGQLPQIDFAGMATELGAPPGLVELEFRQILREIGAGLDFGVKPEVDLLEQPLKDASTPSAQTSGIDRFILTLEIVPPVASTTSLLQFIDPHFFKSFIRCNHPEVIKFRAALAQAGGISFDQLTPTEVEFFAADVRDLFPKLKDVRWNSGLGSLFGKSENVTTDPNEKREAVLEILGALVRLGAYPALIP